MTLVKWIGTILCLIGIALTSINVFPSNIWFGLVGSAIWSFAGIYQRDIPLFLVEFVAVAFYGLGVVTYYFS
jgi:drug/metabolite transporter (DMT)-like permease